MAVLRNGKIAKVHIRKRKMNNLFKKFGIKECKVKLYRVETHRKESRYNLRSRTNSNPLESVVKIAMSPKLLKTKQIARISHENIIWNEVISRDYVRRICNGQNVQISTVACQNQYHLQSW